MSFAVRPRTLALLLVTGALVAAALFTFRSRGALVDVVAVETRALKQTVVVSGRVLAPARIDVGSTITGRIERVAVADGDRVAPGAVLVELERTELAAALAQADAALAAARTRIEQWREVGSPGAQQQLAQAEANLAVADADVARQEALFAKGFIGAARVEEARRGAAVALAQAETARAAARASAPAGVDRRLLDDQLQQAKAARDVAAAKLAQTRITAPAAGTVLDRAVEPGDIVQPGKKLVTLIQDGDFRLTALIDEKNLALLKPGQTAVAALDAWPAQRFRAVLDYLAPGIDVQRGTVEAKFGVPEPTPTLRADMTVSIDIEVADRPQARVVPAAALRNAAGEPAWVLTLADGTAKRTPVRTGARGAGSVEIVEGLADGARVIVSPGIAPDERVRIRG